MDTGCTMHYLHVLSWYLSRFSYSIPHVLPPPLIKDYISRNHRLRCQLLTRDGHWLGHYILSMHLSHCSPLRSPLLPSSPNRLPVKILQGGADCTCPVFFPPLLSPPNRLPVQKLQVEVLIADQGWTLAGPLHTISKGTCPFLELFSSPHHLFSPSLLIDYLSRNYRLRC